VFSQSYRSRLELYVAELQQVWEGASHVVVAGGRAHAGGVDVENHQGNGSVPFVIDQSFGAGYDRLAAYVYDQWLLTDSLRLVGGVAVDRVGAPENFRYAPLSTARDSTTQVSPKAGLLWTPAPETTVRGAYARLLGGMSLDQSFQLEPSQVAGINQAYRSLIPESEEGASGTPRMTVGGISVSHRFGKGTYALLSGDWLESTVVRRVGAVGLQSLFPPVLVPVQTPQHLAYRERSIQVGLHQLIGGEVSIRAGYRLSHAELRDEFPEMVGGVPPGGFWFRPGASASWDGGPRWTPRTPPLPLTT
jgi:hypothetical protein